MAWVASYWKPLMVQSRLIIDLMACLKRIDAWPSSDLGLIVAIQRLKGMQERPDYLTIEKIAEPWSPFRTVAALILWSTYDKE